MASRQKRIINHWNSSSFHKHRWKVSSRILMTDFEYLIFKENDSLSRIQLIYESLVFIIKVDYKRVVDIKILSRYKNKSWKNRSQSQFVSWESWRKDNTEPMNLGRRPWSFGAIRLPRACWVSWRMSDLCAKTRQWCTVASMRFTHAKTQNRYKNTANQLSLHCFCSDHITRSDPTT